MNKTTSWGHAQQKVVGMQGIADKYQIRGDFTEGAGAYEWKKRMGIHLAYHRNPTNIAIHAIFSLVNAWAVLLITYPFSFFNVTLFGLPIDFAMATLLLIWVLYIRMDFLCGTLTTLAYGATYFLCAPTMALLNGEAYLMVLLGSVLTVAALAVQVYIGHSIAEDGIDDAFENFRELFQSKNPLYLALLPFYTYLDLMFMLGYRPNLSARLWAITDELRNKILTERAELKRGGEGTSDKCRIDSGPRKKSRSRRGFDNLAG